MAPYMHQRFEVSSEARKTGGEQTFTVLSHHPGSLQHWAVEDVRNSSSSETDRQQNARKQLRKVLPKPFNSETEALQAVFEALDDLLFFGSLKHRTTLRFGQPKEHLAAAECSWVDSSGRVHITIKPKQPDIFGPGGRWCVLLSLLLPESCHAYFFLYACQVGSCQVECGMTGHGPAWENVAEWVEYQMKHDWGWILDMRVESSIMLEITPQAEKLKQQAREYEDRARQLEELEEQDSEHSQQDTDSDSEEERQKQDSENSQKNTDSDSQEERQEQDSDDSQEDTDSDSQEATLVILSKQQLRELKMQQKQQLGQDRREQMQQRMQDMR